ncbi:MAG: hemolysin III family protein [Tissierellia bacterium]|nr:hemolysin III family protein [Tissierellia bacterium]
MTAAPTENHQNTLEIHNAVTHGIGVLLGILFLLLLTIPPALEGNVLRTVAYAIYGGCFILMFLASTIYHGVRVPRLKSILRIFDHISIYYFILGSFAPVVLLLTQGKQRIFFLAFLGLLTLSGTVFKIATARAYDRLKSLSTFTYIAMGWTAVFLLRPMFRAHLALPLLIALGGVLYTVGTIFYKNKSLKYHHVIWHLFVLAAAVTHFFAFYFFL